MLIDWKMNEAEAGLEASESQPVQEGATASSPSQELTMDEVGKTVNAIIQTFPDTDAQAPTPEAV